MSRLTEQVHAMENCVAELIELVEQGEASHRVRGRKATYVEVPVDGLRKARRMLNKLAEYEVINLAQPKA